MTFFKKFACSALVLSFLVPDVVFASAASSISSASMVGEDGDVGQLTTPTTAAAVPGAVAFSLSGLAVDGAGKDEGSPAASAASSSASAAAGGGGGGSRGGRGYAAAEGDGDRAGIRIGKRRRGDGSAGNPVVVDDREREVDEDEDVEVINVDGGVPDSTVGLVLPADASAQLETKAAPLRATLQKIQEALRDIEGELRRVIPNVKTRDLAQAIELAGLGSSILILSSTIHNTLQFLIGPVQASVDPPSQTDVNKAIAIISAVALRRQIEQFVAALAGSGSGIECRGLIEAAAAIPEVPEPRGEG